jgi:hypothetical protein
VDGEVRSGVEDFCEEVEAEVARDPREEDVLELGGFAWRDGC